MRVTVVHLARGLALALVVSALVVLRSASPAYACSCVGIERVLAQPESIQAAFVGTVIDAPEPFNGGSSARLVTWTFRVEGVYRGELPATVQVKAAVSGVSCGFEGIRVGSRIGVLLRREDGDWHSGLCSSGAPEKFAVLGAPLAPMPDAVVDPSSSSSSTRGIWFIGLGAAVVAVVAVGVLVRRRKVAGAAA